MALLKGLGSVTIESDAVSDIDESDSKGNGMISDTDESDSEGNGMDERGPEPGSATLNVHAHDPVK